MNIIEVFIQFPDQEACIKHLEKARWGDTPICPYCGSDNTYDLKGELRHHCNACRKSFSVTVKTLFEDTKLPMQKWFLAIALILDAKKGISARQLARHLQVNKDTAWRISMEIRKAMNDDGQLLTGIIEMDETFIGGKPRPKNRRNDNDDDKPGSGFPKGKWSKSNKTPVVGMVERKGRVKAKPVGKLELRAWKVESLVRQRVDTANSLLITDESSIYNRMDSVIRHKQVNHYYTYADCGVHTNSIESFWAILKRSIIGSFHKVSARHLAKYVDEVAYKYKAFIYLANTTQLIVSDL